MRGGGKKSFVVNEESLNKAQLFLDTDNDKEDDFGFDADAVLAKSKNMGKTAGSKYQFSKGKWPYS